MNTLVRSFFVVVCALAAICALAATASAQPAPIINVVLDENGNGKGFEQTLQWSIGPDPGPAGLPNALRYQLLPVPLVVGDVLIMEPTGTISDLVRFNPDGMIVFYSDLPEVPGAQGDLADVGIPTAFYPNQVVIQEIGNEGFNYAEYFPTPNEPGSIAVAPIGYRFISNVPEPATMSLLALGGLAVLRRRR